MWVGSRFELGQEGSHFWGELLGSFSCLGDGLAIKTLSLLVKSGLEVV